MADDQNPELPLTPPPSGGDGTGIPGALNIQPVNIEEEMKKSYLDYSMSVIIGRALPDVRDGLKPVHRRILYTMQQMGLAPNRATRKCARIVGEVMGKYHPHGNLAVYDALVRLAQIWRMWLPRCWRIWTKKQWTSGPTTTAARSSPMCCPLAFPIC